MNKRAFTLVEIMIVVGIIAVLATLSISLMLRNTITTNETIAIGSCKTVISACQSYYAVTSPRSYPPDLLTLGQAGPTGPAYVDSNIASGAKSGYNLIYRLTSPVTFILYAEPQFRSRTGVRYFYADETGRITAREGARARPSDPAVS